MEVDEDFKCAVGWNRFNLSLVGIWPDPVLLKTQKGLSKYRFVIPGLFMCIFIAVPQTANLPYIWGNINLVTENLAAGSIPACNAFLNLVFVRYHQKPLSLLLASFRKDWYGPKTTEERKIMLNDANLAKKISIWCTVLTQIMVTIYIVLRLIAMICGNKEETDPYHTILYPGYFPYDVHKSPIHELTWIAQIFSAYCATVTYTGTDSFISMLVLHACAQFTNLGNKLENLITERTDAKKQADFQRELTWIVQRHEHLNWFSKTIEDSFNFMLLLQILLSTIQLCFQGFQFYKIIGNNEKELAIFELIFLITYIAFTIVHLYIYCYVGEMLLIQSARMGTSAYQSKWYNAPRTQARCLSFIIYRASIPAALTVGKFKAISMEMFSSIIRTAMGYLSVLLTVASNDD